MCLSDILTALILQLYKNRNRTKITERTNSLKIKRFITSTIIGKARDKIQECFALVLSRSQERDQVSLEQVTSVSNRTYIV